MAYEVLGIVRFTADDDVALWKEGDLAEDLGWESPESGLPIRLLRKDGEVLALTDPFGRGLVEAVD